MDMGKRLKEARLARGLSQRQLCGDRISRNMLSLIENGTARPSMETLLYLADRLGKPVGYFLEEAVSYNQQVILQARQAAPEEALERLKAYESPDPVFDPEYYLLTALSALRLARQAAGEGRLAYCRELTALAADAGAKTPYYTPELERERLLIAYLADPDSAPQLENALPASDEPLLHGQAALCRNDPKGCLSALASTVGPKADRLRAEAYFMEKDYENALKIYKTLPETMQDLSKMEICCRELRDFEQAYAYACRQR